MPRTDTLALDFGTSNTAAAVLEDGHVRRIALEPGQDTLPTAVFLDYHSRSTAIGQAAVQALTGGRDGRFLRALKSVLGTPLFHERRQFLNERLTLSEITTRFIAEVKARAEADCGRAFPRVLSGRPVRFHSRDDARDAQAEADLTACYVAAGFDTVAFLYEPAAAALSAPRDDVGLGLIVDIGGGTSDFSVFDRVDGQTRVLASHGIRLGGTDFDRALSLAHVMPQFGKGTGLRAEIGDAVHDAPVAPFHALATWQMIPFLYTPQTRREAAHMARVAVRPDLFARLVGVLTDELGHDVAFAVERGKIAANGAGGDGSIDLGIVERGLRVPLTAQAMNATLDREVAAIAGAATETLALTGITPDRIARIVPVGGSSLLAAVSGAVQALMPGARMERGNAFTAVVDGLAIAAAEG